MKNIVVIGGGTGTFTVLSALKQYRDLNLSAIVSMADDGGSTGKLRDELGVLPPGDVRQCLVALSESDLLMRELFNYRFTNGGLKGHNFGNLFISALEKITGGFDSAIDALEDILKIRGKVVPVTLDKVKLFAEFENGEMMVGEGKIDTSENLLSKKVKRFFLSPQGEVNPKAKEVIEKADYIVIGPGDVYTSIIPNFLVNNMASFICNAKGKKIYLCNLMTKFGHSDNFSVADFAVEVEKYLGKNCLDYVIYNDKKPTEELIKKYARKKEYFVDYNKQDFNSKKYKSIGRDLIGEARHGQDKNDEVKRTLIRHNLENLGEVILSIVKEK
jgi:uncharacterized cofD-like protein